MASGNPMPNASYNLTLRVKMRLSAVTQNFIVSKKNKNPFERKKY
jgi:hypothetical protein